jgi:hypothetical protein
MERQVTSSAKSQVKLQVVLLLNLTALWAEQTKRDDLMLVDFFTDQQARHRSQGGEKILSHSHPQSLGTQYVKKPFDKTEQTCHNSLFCPKS